MEESVLEKLFKELDEADIAKKLFPNWPFYWLDMKKKYLELEKVQTIRVGDIVECIADDPVDKHYGFAKKNCWQIGESFKVKKIETFPYGTFLHDGKGHNMDINRAKIKIKK